MKSAGADVCSKSNKHSTVGDGPNVPTNCTNSPDLVDLLVRRDVRWVAKIGSGVQILGLIHSAKRIDDSKFRVRQPNN